MIGNFMFMVWGFFLYLKKLTMCPFALFGLMYISFQREIIDFFITFKLIQHQQSLFITIYSSDNAPKSTLFVLT